MKNLTQKEIADLKEIHGEIWQADAETHDGTIKSCILRKPTRKEINYAMITSQKSGMLKFNEVILAKCWLLGDEEIKTEDYLFMGISGTLDEIISSAEATIKKL